MFVKRKLREPAVFTFENRVGRRSTGGGAPAGGLGGQRELYTNRCRTAPAVPHPQGASRPVGRGFARGR